MVYYLKKPIGCTYPRSQKKCRASLIGLDKTQIPISPITAHNSAGY